MKKLISLMIILFLSFNLSCFKADEEEEQGDTAMNYVIPPDSSMSIDFSSFESINSRVVRADSTPGTNDIDPAEGACLVAGALLVTWSNLVVFVPLAVPIAIFKVLRTQIPTEATSTHVKWSYTYNNHRAVVEANKTGTQYDWEWSVTIDDFIWITGESADDKTGGWWQFHDPTISSGNDNSILVEWTNTDSTNRSVKFTNNNDTLTNTKKGDYIYYEQTGSDVSVTFYDIHSGNDDSGTVEETKVYWNLSTEAGGIDVVTGSAADCTWDPND